MRVEGKRERGRPRRRWMESVKKNKRLEGDAYVNKTK